jgi:hypothetical protein
MTDVPQIALVDETPEVDAAEQHRTVDCLRDARRFAAAAGAQR